MVSFQVYPVANGLAVDGELDMATVPLLQSAVDQSLAGSEIVVDLSGMTFVDSVGLVGLLSIVRSDRSVRLVNPSRTALRVMVVAGVERELMNA
jgi:anti-sigma B factor antagonist/stage II sporulation protein AA (anti-sigma F factor antagonist)